jgi:hypothetical protein
LPIRAQSPRGRRRFLLQYGSLAEFVGGCGSI